MAHTLLKQASQTYTPAVREVIAQPAHTVVLYTRKQVVRYGGANKLGISIPMYGFYPDPVTGKMVQGIIGYTPQVIYGATPYLVWVDEPTYINYPEVLGVAGRDASISVDNQLGWTGGGRSIRTLAGDLRMEFTIKAGSIGVAAGLTVPGATPTLASIEHGFLYSAGDVLRAVERGGVVASAPAVVAGDNRVSVSRVGTTVTYRAGAWSYTSTAPSTGDKALGAVLYAAGDAVSDPTMGQMTALQSSEPWGWGDAQRVGSMLSHEAWGWGGRAAVNEGAMRGSFDLTMTASETEYASARMTMDVPDLSASGGFVSVGSSGITTSLELTMVATAIDIDMGALSAEFGLGMIAADYDYGSAHMSLDMDMLGVEFNEAPGTGYTTELMVAVDTYAADPVLYAFLNERLAVGSTFDFLLTMDGELADYLGLFDAASPQMIINAMLHNGVHISDNASAVANTLLQYATNLTTGAVGRYDGFDFKGFCRVGMDTYAWKQSGLYKVGGQAGDNGDLISGLIDFAAEHFDTAQRKRLTSIYLGLATDGQVYVRMMDDRDRAVTYRAKPRGTEYRSDMQQGTSSRFWRMRLELVDATYAELDNVEWLTGATGRRTTN